MEQKIFKWVVLVTFFYYLLVTLWVLLTTIAEDLMGTRFPFFNYYSSLFIGYSVVAIFILGFSGLTACYIDKLPSLYKLLAILNFFITIFAIYLTILAAGAGGFSVD